jgi:hypothetical protein
VRKKAAGRAERGQPGFMEWRRRDLTRSASQSLRVAANRERRHQTGAHNALTGYDLFGQAQPFSQSSQQAHSHLQFGQSLQQSSEQQAAALSLEQQLTTSVASDDVPATLAAMRPATSARPPNIFTNI